MNELNQTSFKSLVAKLRSSKLFKTLFSAMFISILSRLSSLGMAIILARELSPSGYGAFTYAIGIATIVAQISSLGWPMLVTRFVPKYLISSQFGLLKGLIIRGDMIVVAASICASVLLWYLGKVGVFDLHVSQGLVLAAALVPALTALTLRKAQLAAQKKPVSGLFYKEFFPPTLMVLLSFTLIGENVDHMFFIFAGFNYFAVLIASFAAYKSWPTEFYANTQSSDLRKWLMISLPLIAAVAGKMIMSKSDILMLMPLSNVEEVGYYGAVFRITYLLTFGQVVVMTVLSPLLSEAIALKDFSLVKQRFFLAVAASLLLSLPIAIFVLIFQTEIVEIIFGAEYLPGVTALVFLVFSQTAVAINMPLTSLMIMAGKEKLYATVMLLALVLNIYLNWQLIPLFGAEGAAKATLAASWFNLVFGLIICWSIMKKLRSEYG